MIRTVITPTTSNFNITLDFPESYLGKEIEIIAFQKEEGLIKEKPKKSMADFWGSISDETAAELHKEVEQSRNEWEDRVNKQF
jgi:hypothetical protein